MCGLDLAKPSKEGNMHKKFIIIIMLLGLVAYGNTLFNSLICDDEFVIVNNLFVRKLSNLSRFFDKSYLTKTSDVFFRNNFNKYDIGSGELSYRPLTTMSHMFEYTIWKLKPYGYHLDNLILHIICAILLYIFVFLVVNDAIVAFWAGVIFVIHPLHAEVVNIVSFREDIFVGIFALLSFIAYIFYKKQNNYQKWIFYSLSVLSFFLALFSKEMAVTIPALIILYDLYFEYKGRLKPVFVNFMSRYLAFFIVAAFYLYVNFVFFKNPEGGALQGYIGGSFYTNMLTMSVAFSDYITSFWLPLRIKILPVYYSPVTRTFFNRDAILAVALIVLFIVLAFKLAKRSKLASFFIFWFFITLLPVANIIPIANPMAYRYAYFPLIGLSVIAGMVLSQLRNSNLLRKISPNLYKILQISVVVLLVSAAIPQNVFYKDRFSHGTEALRSFPKNPQSLGDVGFAAMEQGLYYKALVYFGAVTATGQHDPGTFLNAGICFDYLGKYDQAIASYKNALLFRPDYSTAYYNIGIAYLKKEDYNNAIINFQESLKLDPRLASAWRFIAEAYLEQKKTNLAIEAIHKGLDIDPEDKDLKELLLKTETKK
ncbi:MAG: tetratricopeptide repeat protein [Candidatus Omnitrophica bacterium]|nr:tetratricopeptide repeat protein [Candidatus Omnitrophota bacterium]